MVKLQKFEKDYQDTMTDNMESCKENMQRDDTF
jgi:hypothetical protein